VQDLQRDLAALGMHRVGHLAVAPGRRVRGQRAGEGLGPALDVGREAAGDDQPHAAARALGEERGHGREVLAPVFQAGVHADPISTRLGSVVKPRSSGASRCG
jgi:hypothetical protein